LQRAFKTYESLKEKESTRKIKACFNSDKAFTVESNTIASIQEAAICSLKIIFDTMNDPSFQDDL